MEHQTRLVETNSDEAQGGELVIHLSKKLKDNGVQLQSYLTGQGIPRAQ